MHIFSQINTQLHDLLKDFYPAAVSILKIIGIIILCVVLSRVGSFIIKRLFEKQKKFKYAIDSKRVDTLSTVLSSIFRYVIYILSGVSILAEITNLFNLNSILTAAGIGGIVLGLGAQNLIKDIISGFFIILEDQFAVGDLITIDTLNGTVEEIELRVTKFRNFNGDLYIIPNGEIKKVINHTRGNKAVIVDIPIAYSSDIEKAFETASIVCKMVSEEFKTIVEQPKVLGITEMDKDSVNLRIIAKTLPNEQWEVERRIRRLIKEEFDKQKIKFSTANEIIFNRNISEGGEANGGQV